MLKSFIVAAWILGAAALFGASGNLEIYWIDAEGGAATLIVFLVAQRRLRDLTASERAQRSLAHRGIFREALTWMEIHGDSPDVVEHWMGILDEGGDAPEASDEAEADEQPPTAGDMPHKRRRRRRRRGRRGGGGHTQV